MGRKKLWDRRITLPLDDTMLIAIDATLEPGEIRLDLIRQAIASEL